MTKKDKLLEKFKSNPKSLSFKELEKILLDLDFIKIEAKGSHVKFKYQSFDLVFALHNGDCKDFYKKETLKKLENNLLFNSSYNEN